MTIKIRVLNVKDADAIIIQLAKEKNNFVILIDGGHAGDAELVIGHLNDILKATNKKGPDLIICTHYDSDHIGGLKKVIEYYKNEIKQILIHRTTEILDIPSKIKLSEKKGGGIMPSESDLSIGGDVDFSDVRKEAGVEAVLESIQQEIDLLKLIDLLKIPCAEPIAGNFIAPGWDEFRILGPTGDFYKKLFPKHFNTKQFLIQEAVDAMSGIDLVEDKEKDPCKLLDKLKKSGVTNANMNSAIIKITMDDKSFLFAGDAGIESFKNIPNWEKELKDIFWLKVPHHGSRNNINCELIELMSPKFSVISANKNAEDCVIGCLEKTGSKVYVTKNADSYFEYSY